MKLTQVTNENIHTILPEYIYDNDITINDIESMIDTYMNMVKKTCQLYESILKNK